MIDEYVYNNISKITQPQEGKDKCVCAQTDYLPRILKLIRFILVCDIILIISTLLLYENIQLPHSIQYMIALLSVIAFFAQIYYLYLLIIFIKDVKIRFCDCVDSYFKWILNGYTLFAIFMIPFNIILSYFVDMRIIHRLNILSPITELVSKKS